MSILKYVFIFIFSYSSVFAQILAPSLQNTADNVPNFNFSEIKKLKIKTIVFDMVDKKDFQIAEDKDLSRHYEFDSLGRLTRYYYTVISRIIQKEFHTAPVYKRRRLISAGGTYSKNVYEFDTLSCIFLYDANNNLTCKRLKDGNFYSATYYWYDSINKLSLVRVLSCKETNASLDKSVFVLGTQQVLFDERYRYILSSHQERARSSYMPLRLCQPASIISRYSEAVVSNSYSSRGRRNGQRRRMARRIDQNGADQGVAERYRNLQ